MCLMKFFVKQKCFSRFFQEERNVHGLCRGIKQDKKRFLKIATRLYGHRVFFPKR